MTPSPEDLCCTDLAREINVPLVGSATRGNLWFLLEYTGRWEAKAFEQADLPAAVRTVMLDAAAAVEHGRILLIRQSDSHLRSGLRFFVVQADAQVPRQYEFHFDTVEDLLALDLPRLAFDLAAGRPGPQANLRTEPLYLVCTNGLRDRCCARFGPQIYQTLKEQAGRAVWQSSHIGGHNKAPVLLFFPHGLNYGRVTPQEAALLVRAYQHNQIYMDALRGRVCYDAPVQAAEHFWRLRQANFDLPGPQFGPAVPTGEERWQVAVHQDGELLETIRVARRTSEQLIPITCAGNKLAPFETYLEIEHDR